MTQLLLTFLVVVLLFAAMAIGVIAGRKPIKGSCGGMSALGMDTACDICGGDPVKCDEQQEQREPTRRDRLGYDAMEEL